MDFKGAVTAHRGNHPTLKLIQILAPVQRSDALLCCREDIVGILKIYDDMETRLDGVQGYSKEDRMEYGRSSCNEY